MKGKICIFNGYFLPHLGGVERYVSNLASSLNDLGYEVTIVASNDDNGESYVETEKFRVFRLSIFSLFKNRYPILNYFSNKEQIKEIEKENYDLLILNTRFYLHSLIGAKLAKKKQIPLYLIEHGTSHFTVNNKFLDLLGSKYEHFLTFLLKKHVDKYFGVSKACSLWLKHFNINSNGQLYNSVNSEDREKYQNLVLSEVSCSSNNNHNVTYNNTYNKNMNDNTYNRDINDNNDNSTGCVVISYAGRVIKEKGILNLLNCFNKLNKKYDDIKLFIAGDGDLLSEIKINENYKSNKNIVFLGKLPFDKVMALYNQTDIFTHPSMYPEGLPTSILEAGLMNCVIVATDRGGTAEVIINSDYGLIVEETEESLFDALDYLLYNRDEIKKLGNNLENRVVNNFTWGKTAEKLLKSLEGD